MATNVLEATLKRLLVEVEEPQIVSMTGGWGTGKTHFWREFAETIEGVETAYISLFGLLDVEQLRQAIVASILATKPRNQRVLKQALQSIGAIKFQGLSIPTSLLNEAFFARFLKPGLILCLDDLERTSLDVSFLLGFVNNLREKHAVNALLIFNEEPLSIKREFNDFREKVIDRELPFCVDLDDVVRIAVRDPGLRHTVADSCRSLGLSNIRIIKRSIQLFDEFIEVASSEDRALLDQALRSLLLFAYIKYSPESVIETLDELENYSELGAEVRLQALLQSASEQRPSSEGRAGEAHLDREKINFLRSCSYNSTSSLDRALLGFVRDGILDERALRRAILERAGHDRISEKDASLQMVWNSFNHSFTESEDVLCGQIRTVCEHHLHVLSLRDTDNLLWLLGQIGEEDTARSLRTSFVTENRARIEQGVFSQELDEIRDSALVSMIGGILQRVNDSRTLAETIEVVFGGNSWRPEDVLHLDQFSEDDFVQYFESDIGPPLGDRAKSLVRFASQYTNPTETQRAVQEKAISALRRIAAKSPYNAARIRRFLALEVD